MADYKYLIVGGGMAARAAAEGIRAHDSTNSVALFAAEADPPYRRPPLTKGLWKGDAVEEVFYDISGLDLSLHLDTMVQNVDKAEHTVLDSRGQTHRYEKLLLATGGTPRRLPYGGDDIIYYRTFADYRRLRDAASQGASVAIIGGGFIGSELAASLAMNGCQVTMVFPERTLGERHYPGELAAFLHGYFIDKGVQMRAAATVQSFESEGGRHVLTISSGAETERLAADVVVAGIGITPNVGLAEQAGLETSNGIVVDNNLRTADPDIFAAGDVAAFDNPWLGGRVRVEHEDNAKAMGRVAGANMTGAAEPYTHMPFFYTDLFDIGYEAVGMLDARLDTISDWVEPNRKGVIFYTREDRVKGVLLWNVWRKVPAARELIQSERRYETQDLIGLLTSAGK